jgi:hypothetical protein
MPHILCTVLPENLTKPPVYVGGFVVMQAVKAHGIRNSMAVVCTRNADENPTAEA